MSLRFKGFVVVVNILIKIDLEKRKAQEKLPHSHMKTKFKKVAHIQSPIPTS